MDGIIEFKNSTACEWSGKFSNNGTNLDIAMNAADSQNGVQTLRFSSKGYLGNTDINNVTVNSGRLNLGMHSGMKGNRLSLIGSGGTFSPTGIGGGDIGTATFAEGEWYARQSRPRYRG